MHSHCGPGRKEEVCVWGWGGWGVWYDSERGEYSALVATDRWPQPKQGEEVCGEFKWDFSLIQVLLAHRMVFLIFQKWFVKYFASWLGVCEHYLLCDQ